MKLLKLFVMMMNKNTWKTIFQMLLSILTAIATTLGISSCAF
ncbi:MAG: smalltalk protein [Prevotella sp.]|nr:smalltalk protein [Prevotella sp.]MDD3387216.1 smalltalk protein [Prevotella sp.]MDD4534873.1 smalltalk protein [Prevotella sp.]MDT3387174.1 smalltalk protein [Bacteroidota bacterium]